MKAVKVCVVCGRDGARVEDIDGVRVVACAECLADPFRRPRTVEFTRNGRPR